MKVVLYMALIKCVECGNNISDKSEYCPQCGCPTSESLKILEYEQYKENLVYKCPVCNKEYPDGIFKCDICGYIHFVTDSIKDELIKEDLIEKSNQPKCPTCQSPNIKKISGGAKMLGALGFGLFSKTARSQFECLNCGYKW